MEGHFGEVWTLAVGKYGNFIASASHDKSIRIWEKTEDQFVLEEEREERMEKLYQEMDLQDEKYNQEIGTGADGQTPVESQNEKPTRSTLESLKSGELLSEALLIYDQERQDFAKYQEVNNISNIDG